MTPAPPQAVIQVRVTNAASLVEVRREVGGAARALNFGLVEHTKLLTASLELARNVADHAGSGTLTIERLQDHHRSGLRLTFVDAGPGIPDVDLAMQDGYSSGKGMGMGLPGAKRLVHEFSIVSEPGKGVCVAIVMWKR